MKDKVIALSSLIENTGIITNWGGWCIHYQAKIGMEYPYGVTDAGVLYTYDDNHLCSGYLYISNIRAKQGSHNNAVVVTVSVHVYTNIKKQGDVAKSYTRPLSLFGVLSRHYRTIRINTPTPEKAYEYAIIEIDIDTFAPCEFLESAQENNC